MYVIDNKYAILGSLNFTNSGTKYNHETSIFYKDKKNIARINNEIKKLAQNKEYSTLYEYKSKKMFAKKSILKKFSILFLFVIIVIMYAKFAKIR